MDVPHFTDPALFNWLFADEVLNLVKPILGPDLALFASHFICKPKGDGRRVPWHEDSTYWARPMKILDPMEVVTVWLAIDPSTQKNGCMYVIPRTHHHGYSNYQMVDASKNVFANEIVESERDEKNAVPCILRPNEASLHEGRLIHGSAANTSDLRRCGYTMRYISSSTVLNPEILSRHQIYLACGSDLAGQSYADPSKSYPDLMLRRGRADRGH